MCGCRTSSCCSLEALLRSLWPDSSQSSPSTTPTEGLAASVIALRSMSKRLQVLRTCYFPLRLALLSCCCLFVFSRMFWRVVSQMNNIQRQQLLYFATGSAALPATLDTNTRSQESLTQSKFPSLPPLGRTGQARQVKRLKR